MAKADLDLVVHLGDYIYEGGAKEKGARKHLGPEITTLTHYRNRHALYKTDEHLQAVHQRFPWVVTWDDHEVENNYAGQIEQDEPGNVEAFLRRRANAYQAYYEHMPLRRSALPKGPDMTLYRRVRFGRLAEFSVLDTRQYRTDQPNGDGGKPRTGGALDPKGTLLGRKQEGWLYSGLIQSPATWNVLAQQVMVARVGGLKNGERIFSMDQWSGYDVARNRLLEFLKTRNVPNPIVITGDIHSNWCNDLYVDFDKLKDGPVASEFVGTSISSGGDGEKDSPRRKQMLADNPFVKFFDMERGFVQCTVTPKSWRSDYQVVEYVSRPGAPLVTRASFVVEQGLPGVKPA
jgi:alkaline phosphatase D